MMSPVERLRESIYKSQSWLDVENELADFDKYVLEYLGNGHRKIPEDSLDFL